MFKQLSQFMQDTNQYYLKQFGFHLNNSTTHAIAELVGEILQGFNDDMYTAALFIDLRKAFDCVDDNILLNKLSNYGITGVAHDSLIVIYIIKDYTHPSITISQK